MQKGMIINAGGLQPICVAAGAVLGRTRIRTAFLDHVAKVLVTSNAMPVDATLRFTAADDETGRIEIEWDRPKGETNALRMWNETIEVRDVFSRRTSIDDMAIIRVSDRVETIPGGYRAMVTITLEPVVAAEVAA